MEYYDNDVSVHSAYIQTVFYGLCLKIKYILSYLILKRDKILFLIYHLKQTENGYYNVTLLLNSITKHPITLGQHLNNLE